MGTKYSSQSSSGYNSSPPVDDGTQSEANKVKWSTIKTKLADVLKTFVEAVNSALVTALDHSARAVSASDSAAASDNERTIQVNTSSVTITLADATTMAAGYIVDVSNQSSGDITVALASATDTIDTVTNTTQTISAKEARRYIVNATSDGYITSADRVVAASTTIPGKVELATQAEVNAMTDTGRVLTPNHNKIVLGTEQASTSGTNIDFASIPSGVRRIDITFEGVGTNGTSNFLVQLGDAGGIEDTGYVAACSRIASGGVADSSSTAGFPIAYANASHVTHATMTLVLKDSAGFTWSSSHAGAETSTPQSLCGGGTKSLSAELTQLRITTVSGDTFDAGAINISYER